MRSSTNNNVTSTDNIIGRLNNIPKKKCYTAEKAKKDLIWAQLVYNLVMISLQVGTGVAMSLAKFKDPSQDEDSSKNYYPELELMPLITGAVIGLIAAAMKSYSEMSESKEIHDSEYPSSVMKAQDEKPTAIPMADEDLLMHSVSSDLTKIQYMSAMADYMVEVFLGVTPSLLFIMEEYELDDGLTTAENYTFLGMCLLFSLIGNIQSLCNSMLSFQKNNERKAEKSPHYAGVDANVEKRWWHKETFINFEFIFRFINTTIPVTYLVGNLVSALHQYFSSSTERDYIHFTLPGLIVGGVSGLAGGFAEAYSHKKESQHFVRGAIKSSDESAKLTHLPVDEEAKMDKTIVGVGPSNYQSVAESSDAIAIPVHEAKEQNEDAVKLGFMRSLLIFVHYISDIAMGLALLAALNSRYKIDERVHARSQKVGKISLYAGSALFAVVGTMREALFNAAYSVMEDAKREKEDAREQAQPSRTPRKK
jgi:hypothetical protein